MSELRRPGQSAFEEAESAYPSFHQSYEIARLLNATRATRPLQRPKKSFRKIVADYSWEAPASAVEKLRDLAAG